MYKELSQIYLFYRVYNNVVKKIIWRRNNGDE